MIQFVGSERVKQASPINCVGRMVEEDTFEPHPVGSVRLESMDVPAAT